jgi:hypothetical protein
VLAGREESVWFVRHGAFEEGGDTGVEHGCAEEEDENFYTDELFLLASLYLSLQALCNSPKLILTPSTPPAHSP